MFIMEEKAGYGGGFFLENLIWGVEIDIIASFIGQPFGGLSLSDG